MADSLESDPDSVENAAYEAAKSAGAKPRDVFVCMYQILLGSASGPRLGPFMADIGAAKVAGMGFFRKKSGALIFITSPLYLDDAIKDA